MIQFDQVSLRRGGRVLFQKRLCNYTQLEDWSDWEVNGAGKSTLFAALLGSLGADEGSLTRPSVWTVAHMAQEVKALDMPAIDFVLSGDEEYWDIQNKLAQPEQLTDSDLAKLHGRLMKFMVILRHLKQLS